MIRRAGRTCLKCCFKSVGGSAKQSKNIPFSLCSGLTSQISSSFEVTVTALMKCKKANALP